MKLTINGVDYAAALDAVKPLTIERKLNQPSSCMCFLSFGASSTLAVPVRNQPIAVVSDSGTVYFTGYIAATPLPEYAGLGVTGPQYRYVIEAFSDEILLDQQLLPPGTTIANESVSTVLNAMVAHTGSSALHTGGLALSTSIANFTPAPGSTFSENVGEIANQARVTYHALGGSLYAQNVGGTVHTLDETQGTLTLNGLEFSAAARRALANDMTVCGEHEPVAYVTEYFLGDGVTTQFELSQTPFFLSAAKSKIINELFNEGHILNNLWAYSGASGYIQLGAGGLTFNGGNGIDGETVIYWIDPVEMSGTLMLEAIGVSLSPGSSGVLAAFSTGLLQQADCQAGFLVRSSGGNVTLQPLISGLPTGTAYTINPAFQYNLRVRVHAPEFSRSTAVYRSYGDSGLITTGGSLVFCGAKVTVEIQESANGLTGMPVVLYDGTINNLIGNGMILAGGSINLIGSMRALNLTNLGSGWVVTTPSGGTPYTRRIGTLAEGAECNVERSGKCVFYTGYQPAAGEHVAVSYRTIGRAVGRAVNAANQAALAAAGLPAISVWIGTVTNPPARTSVDCRNAASALEQAASSASALWAGTYKGTQLNFTSDVWPGDALDLVAPSLTLDVQLVVRAVKVTYSSTSPDIFNYTITFANEWAEDLAIKTSKAVPADAWLPAPISPTYVANISNLTVSEVNGTTVTCSANVVLPPGGGIEVRLRDFDFQPGNDPDLVLRTTVTNITLPRLSQNDRFYLRVYDGNTPPNYSEFSAALFINLPLGS
jgi:hypothetical protein